MLYLIDTHVLLWYLKGERELPKKVADAMLDRKNTLYLSVASIWELAIKMSLGKLKIDMSFYEILDHISGNDYEILNINRDYLETFFSLPPPHHGDPFDRMMIAQAITEKLTIISVDKHFKSYPVDLLW